MLNSSRETAFGCLPSLLAIRKDIGAVEDVAFSLPKDDDDWQYRVLYDHIFSGNGSACDLVEAELLSWEIPSLSYYDPDASYFEDSYAYINAPDRLIEGLSALVSRAG